MSFWDGRWVDKSDIYYEDLVKIESPFFAGKPPHGGMYLLKDRPLSPVACWENMEGEEGPWAARKVVFCGTDADLRRDIEWLMRTARRRPSRGGFAGGYGDRAEASAYTPRPFPTTRTWLGASDPAAVTAVAAAPGVSTGLGDAVDALAAKSPTMQRQLTELQANRWHVGWQVPGKASVTDREEHALLIGDAYRQRPEWAVSQLSHELGHAMHVPAYDFSSKAAFLRTEQLDEGYATLNNITVQREIAANGGPMIPLSVSRENVGTYNRVYDETAASSDTHAAAAAIGAVYGDGERSINPATGAVDTYNQIFGGFYDANYGQGH